MTSDFSNTLNYFKAYSLDKDPFDLGNSDPVYFKTPEIEHRLELIPHLAVFSDRIVQILGREGIGKTSLFQQLQIEMAEQKPVAISATGDETAVGILRMLAETLELTQINSSSTDELLYKVTTRVERAQQSGKVLVLMIDNVEQLSIECLHLLFQLASHEQRQQSVHLIVFTSLDLEHLIQHPGLSLLHTIELEGFHAEQVKPYLDYRLEQAGSPGELLFSDKQISDFYRTSNGNPGIINQLAIQALSDPARLEPQPQKRSSLFAFMFNPVWSYGVSVLVVVFSITYVLFTDKKEQVEIIEVSIPTPAAMQEQNAERQGVDVDTVIALATEEEEIQSAIDAESVEVVIEPVQISNPVPEPVNMATESAKPEKEPSAEMDPMSSESVQSVANSPTTTSAAKPAKNTDNESNKAEKIETPSTSVSGIRGADWLQSQSSRNYVLQLIGVHDPTILSKIINSHPNLKGQLSRFATLNSGKPWYVLVYGNYTDRGQAISDIPGLPASIRKLKPWPRTMASIHIALKKAVD